MPKSAYTGRHEAEPKELLFQAATPTPVSQLIEHHAAALIGLEPEAEFHDLAELAAALCSTPMALVSLVEGDFLHHKGMVGLSIARTSRADSICDFMLRQDDGMTVPDVSLDARFAGLGAVVENPGLRFYAGVPLLSPSGNKIGSLCVLDTIKRELKPWQASALKKLGQQVNAQIELRMRRKLAERTFGSLEVGTELFAKFSEGIPFSCYLKDNEHRLLFYNRHLSRQFDVTPKEWLGKTSHDIWPGALADQVREAEETLFRSGHLLGHHGELLVQLPARDGRTVASRLYQSVYRGPLGDSVLAVMIVPVEDTSPESSIE